MVFTTKGTKTTMGLTTEPAKLTRQVRIIRPDRDVTCACFVTFVAQSSWLREGP
jgi:hypothetical protein